MPDNAEADGLRACGLEADADRTERRGCRTVELVRDDRSETRSPIGPSKVSLLSQKCGGKASPRRDAMRECPWLEDAESCRKRERERDRESVCVCVCGYEYGYGYNRRGAEWCLSGCFRRLMQQGLGTKGRLGIQGDFA